MESSMAISILPLPTHPRDIVPRYTMFGVRNAINNMQVFEPSSMPLGISYSDPD